MHVVPQPPSCRQLEQRQSAGERSAEGQPNRPPCPLSSQVWPLARSGSGEFRKVLRRSRLWRLQRSPLGDRVGRRTEINSAIILIDLIPKRSALGGRRSRPARGCMEVAYFHAEALHCWQHCWRPLGCWRMVINLPLSGSAAAAAPVASERHAEPGKGKGRGKGAPHVCHSTSFARARDRAKAAWPIIIDNFGAQLDQASGRACWPPD